MTVKSVVVVALGLLASTGLAANAQSKKAKAKAAAKAPVNLHFTIAPTGNEARYRVREQLVGVDLPSDAVGVTHGITGGLVVQPNGVIVSDSSAIVVDVQSLKSDQKRRDASIRTMGIESDKYPTVKIVPTSFSGLDGKPGATPVSFDMVGDMTVHGTTHPTTWKVTAHSDGNDVIGTATTQFIWSDFGMDRPKRAIVLSVMDTVKLEYDFHLVQAPTTP